MLKGRLTLKYPQSINLQYLVQLQPAQHVQAVLWKASQEEEEDRGGAGKQTNNTTAKKNNKDAL